AFEKPQVIVHGIGDGVVASGLASACMSFPCCALCFGKGENAPMVAVLVVVGQDERTVAGAQVLEDIAPVAAVAPRQPRAGAAGELAIAEMQSRLNQPEIRLVRHAQAGAGGSGFEVRIADFAGHDGDSLFTAETSRRVQYGSNIRGWTAMDNSG